MSEKEKTYKYFSGGRTKKITKAERDELIKKSLENSEDKPKKKPKDKPKDKPKEIIK